MNCYHCLLYVAGLLVVIAYDDISHNKLAKQSSTFTGPTYGASTAVDGNIATCTRTLEIGLNSPQKTVWWNVDLGGVYIINSINILFRTYIGYEERQRGRFAGFSLYVSNTGNIQGSIPCYKDGTRLPPLNFTTTCTESGRYVIFYNERLDGVTYPTGYEVTSVITELCEVKVQGCNNASVYGSNCDTPCPTNCKDNTCHIQNGTCFTCTPGWIGIYCNTKCGKGWYGDNCRQQCKGYCKDGTTCNHVTGQCDEGCDAGWTGQLCDNECEDGTYGYDCTNNCSGHCLNVSTCNKQTGHCDKGCKPGYTNGDCNKDCPSGYFGMNCRERCSGHCINNEHCDHVNGVCSNGCQDGYIEGRCDDTCKEGYFGRNCSRICSPNCKPDTCRHTDGLCTSCDAGWVGYNCTIACMKGYFGTNCLRVCSPNCNSDTCRHTDGWCTSCAAGWMGYNCTTGITENPLMKQDMPSCVIFAIALSISLLINLILIGCGILLCRKINSKGVTVSCSLLSCWEKSVYQNTFVKNDEGSTYQELNLSDSTYQNTTIR